MSQNGSDEDLSHLSIAKSGGIILLGTVVGMLFSFLARVIPARLLGPNEYGLLALGITIVSIGTVLGRVGINDGIARNLPRQDAPGEKTGIILSGLVITTTASVIVGAVLLVVSGPLSTDVLGEPGLAVILPVFAVLVPLQTAMMVFISVFRGSGRTLVMVLIRQVTRPVSQVLFITAGLVAGFGLLGAAVGWMLGILVAAAVGGYLAYRITPMVPLGDIVPQYRRLLRFSFPLMLSSMLSMLVIHSDRVLIAFFLTSSDVGVYDSAFTLSKFVGAPATAFAYLFLPTLSSLEKDGNFGRMAELYKLVTKWMVVLALPVFVMLFVFADVVLGSVFGVGYTEGALVLQILAIGYLIRLLAGLNGETMKAIGRTRLIFYIQTVVVGGNIILNVLLIPSLGIAGAAIASVITYAGGNILFVVWLYLRKDIQPISTHLLKALVSAAAAAVVLIAVAQATSILEFWMLVPYGVIFGLLYMVGFILIGGIQAEDIEVIEAIERRAGMEVPFVRQLLDRSL